ncbi:hypothetical protein MON38_01070 [Hymenobacter sp. DH14]|uniref:Proteophosphoglycan ppg4 n=1 Tax=Hymenobacter cyanobacteriorum TaxID=2926463 RepID=A0A9X2ADQ7_9BACT|nr:hypothetical protein [Hymenobacter cyanobacteriorum]MCI1185992.1 hypothetical protein [Hymenobacter cyanobacteriorum]
MTKTLLSTLILSGLLALTAQAQTTPATPAGNHTAGTTSNPVDPTSKTGQAVSGTNRNSSPRNMAPDRPTTPGNHTAGTTDNPVDPTSKTGQAVSDSKRSTDMSTRKTRKTKTRVSY